MMSLKERLQPQKRNADTNRLFDRFGLTKNPFPSAGQTSGNPHLRLPLDEDIDARIETFTRDHISQVIVLVGTQGVGKTNLLNHYEKEIAEALPSTSGYYVIRYLADPEASFDGTLRRLFHELGESHLLRLGEALARDEDSERTIELARSHEIRIALRRLQKNNNREYVASLMLEWLLGLRVLNRHREALGVQFRLDTVESKTLAFRDLVMCSSRLGILSGIFLLLDELEKQDGVLSPIYIVRYLSALRAIIDALPSHLFLMMAVTPDALRRYSVALPAFQSRLQDTMNLEPLADAGDAVRLAAFYITEGQREAQLQRSEVAKTTTPIIPQRRIREIFEEQLQRARSRRDVGLRQREFLHELYREVEQTIQAE
jgi:hypothetical protein